MVGRVEPKGPLLVVTYATAFAGQAGLDVVERYLDLLGVPVHTFSGVRDQVRKCVETPWPRTSLGADGGPVWHQRSAMSIRYDANTKDRAVRLFREHRDDYDSEWRRCGRSRAGWG